MSDAPRAASAAPATLEAPAQPPRTQRRLVDDVLDRMTDGVFGIDREWRITYANARAREHFAGIADELVGESFLELFPGETSGPFLPAYQRVMESQEPAEFEARSVLFASWMRVRVYPSSRGLTIFFQDITREYEARSASRRTREIIDAALDIVVLADISGRILELNAAARRALGLADDTAIDHLTIGSFFPRRLHPFLRTSVKTKSRSSP